MEKDVTHGISVVFKTYNSEQLHEIKVILKKNQITKPKIVGNIKKFTVQKWQYYIDSTS